jgi:hypothetical protein
MLLPLSGHAADSVPLFENGPDQQSPTPPSVEKFSGDTVPVDQAWPYANPYHPASATNFDEFTTPLLPTPEVTDRSRLSLYLSDSGPSQAVYGHFGNPFFPDSINSRGTTDHPFAMDSSTNLYGRTWRGGGR